MNESSSDDEMMVLDLTHYNDIFMLCTFYLNIVIHGLLWVYSLYILLDDNIAKVIFFVILNSYW